MVFFNRPRYPSSQSFKDDLKAARDGAASGDFRYGKGVPQSDGRREEGTEMKRQFSVCVGVDMYSSLC